MARQLIIMGSGENSPAMVTPHQLSIKPLGKSSTRFNLDTPYGFQENADELTSRILGYFEKNVQFPATELQLREASQITPDLVAQVAAADWVFSGPGSPTYALRTWKESGIADALNKVLERGVVVMASAAAMTLGAKVMPVYEMYKVGDAPHWLDGLDILGTATGIKAAVVAHYNNTQGGTHDTRFCFVGEKRMLVLDEMLDGDTSVLGIDEHTGASFNLETGAVDIFGKGNLTMRHKGVEKIYPTKTSTTIEELKNFRG